MASPIAVAFTHPFVDGKNVTKVYEGRFISVTRLATILDTTKEDVRSSRLVEKFKSHEGMRITDGVDVKKNGRALLDHCGSIAPEDYKEALRQFDELGDDELIEEAGEKEEPQHITLREALKRMAELADRCEESVKRASAMVGAEAIAHWVTSDAGHEAISKKTEVLVEEKVKEAQAQAMRDLDAAMAQLRAKQEAELAVTIAQMRAQQEAELKARYDKDVADKVNQIEADAKARVAARTDAGTHAALAASIMQKALAKYGQK